MAKQPIRNGPSGRIRTGNVTANPESKSNPAFSKTPTIDIGPSLGKAPFIDTAPAFSKTPLSVKYRSSDD